MSNEKNTQSGGTPPAQSGQAGEETGGTQNTSGNGDTTGNADNDSLTTGRIAATERSSASSTKTGVAGSDLDGQTSF